MRFARLRLEKRHNFLVKIGEAATHCFVANNIVNVKGVLLAGPAEFKRQLGDGDFLDPRIKKAVVATLDTGYGGMGGFNEAVEQAGDVIKGLEIAMDQKLINQLFTELSKGTNMGVSGVTATMNLFETSCVQTLIVWERLDYYRLTFKNAEGDEVIRYGLRRDAHDVGQLKIVDSILLLEWIADNCEDSGVELRIVSDRTAEGLQFRKGFNGIGGLLRYPMAVEEEKNEDESNGNVKSGDNTDTTGIWD